MERTNSRKLPYNIHIHTMVHRHTHTHMVGGRDKQIRKKNKDTDNFSKIIVSNLP